MLGDDAPREQIFHHNSVTMTEEPTPIDRDGEVSTNAFDVYLSACTLLQMHLLWFGAQ